MKNLIYLLLFSYLSSTAFAQDTFEVEFLGVPTNHQLSWSTSVGTDYQVFMSPDLENWVDTEIVEPGTGSRITIGMMSNTAEKLFYRVHSSNGFMILPVQNQEVDLIDGVCFAFNLNVFSTIPAKIRIFKRDYDNGDPWTQIGLITDFDDIDGIKFVRGSTIWLPDTQGDYEVLAEAVDGTDIVIGDSIRRVIVGLNQAPIISITSGPTTPSASAQPTVFTAEVEDLDGDPIRRVEFYNNGDLIGSDTTPVETNPGVFEFGDDIIAAIYFV